MNTMESSQDRRPSLCTSRRRSSHRSSATRSYTDLLSLTSDVDAALLHPASTWNPISSIQSSFLFTAEELEDLDCEDDSGEGGDEDLFMQVALSAVNIDGNNSSSDRGQDPPEAAEPSALVTWEEKTQTTSCLKKTDDSSTTEELSDPPSSSSYSDESDIEPCEEHYRVPPAREEQHESTTTVLHQEIVCRSDPPSQSDNTKSSLDKSKEELIHRINTQLALVPTTNDKYNGYKHHFITVKEQHRFLLLYNFLKRNLNSKIILYFSTAKSTQYHGKLLDRLQFDVKYIHNRQSKEKFLDTYLAFSKQKRGILCLPDVQQDFAIPPTVSWIVQYEPPHDPTEYIFRIGRLSSEQRDKKQRGGGKALLFLTPNQFNFTHYFNAAHIKYYEYEMHNLSNVQRHYEKLVRRDERLYVLGKEAYHAYLLNYASHEYRDVYDVHMIDKDEVAMSFGFDRAPILRGASRGGEDGMRRVGSREENRWKPSRKEGGDSWMNREDRSWKYADRHSHLMKKDRIRS